MKIGEWKTDSVFRRYRITPRKDLDRAADKMNEFFQREQAMLDKVGTKEGTLTPGSVASKNDKLSVN
jgi:hypothetical protein